MIIYVNWEDHAILSADEVMEMVENECEQYVQDEDCFCIWLEEHYCADEIFHFTNADRKDAMEDFCSDMREAAIMNVCTDAGLEAVEI